MSIRSPTPSPRKSAFSEIVGRLQDRSNGVALLQGKVASDPQLSTLKIWREDAFYDTQSQSLRKLITGLGLFVAIIFSAAAALGAAITMYAQVAGRVREVGTLRAIGFRRRSVLWVFLREAVLLSLVGGVLGIVLASMLSLASFSASNQDSFTEVTFHFRFGLETAIWSLFFAMVMGLLGRLLAGLTSFEAVDRQRDKRRVGTGTAQGVTGLTA